MAASGTLENRGSIVDPVAAAHQHEPEGGRPGFLGRVSPIECIETRARLIGTAVRLGPRSGNDELARSRERGIQRGEHVSPLGKRRKGACSRRIVNGSTDFVGFAGFRTQPEGRAEEPSGTLKGLSRLHPQSSPQR